MFKEVYEAPEVEIIRFQTEDVIAGSGEYGVGGGDTDIPIFKNWG